MDSASDQTHLQDDGCLRIATSYHPTFPDQYENFEPKSGHVLCV